MSGYVAAKLMNYLINDSSKIIVFDPMPKDYHIEERVKGFIDYYTKSDKNITLYPFKGSNASLSVSQYIDDVIREIILMVYFSKCLNISCCAVYKKINKKIYLIGYDLLEENKKYLNENVIDFIIDQEPYKQGYEGVYLLYKYVCLKESIKKTIYLPINIIMKENLVYIYSL